MTADARNLALIAVIAVAPLAIVLIVALLRGYTIDLHMTRDVKRGRRRDEQGAVDGEAVIMVGAVLGVLILLAYIVGR